MVDDPPLDGLEEEPLAGAELLPVVELPAAIEPPAAVEPPEAVEPPAAVEPLPGAEPPPDGPPSVEPPAEAVFPVVELVSDVPCFPWLPQATAHKVRTNAMLRLVVFIVFLEPVGVEA